MKIIMKLILKFIVISILSLFFFLMICAVLLRVPPPKHSDLVSQFHQHREVYEELVRMAHEDRLKGVFHYGDLYRNSFQYGDSELVGINFERAERYKTLMKSSNSPTIFLRESQNVIIPFKSSGWLNDDGWSIALERSNTKPKNLLPNLDLFKNESDEWGMAYSHIEDNWYLKIVW